MKMILPSQRSKVLPSLDSLSCKAEVGHSFLQGTFVRKIQISTGRFREAPRQWPRARKCVKLPLFVSVTYRPIIFVREMPFFILQLGHFHRKILKFVENILRGTKAQFHRAAHTIFCCFIIKDLTRKSVFTFTMDMHCCHLLTGTVDKPSVPFPSDRRLAVYMK